MKTFSQGQRVMVRRNVDGIEIDAVGEVARVRTDGGGWVNLDRRSEFESVHPFFANDETRANHVLVFPEDCDPEPVPLECSLFAEAMGEDDEDEDEDGGP